MTIWYDKQNPETLENLIIYPSPVGSKLKVKNNNPFRQIFSGK